jgi:hypothetical protein
MSTETIETPIENQEMMSELDQHHRSPDEEFMYRPVSSMAVCSLVLGLLSLLGIFLWMVIPVGLLAVLLGGIAILSIRRLKGEYTGTGVAITGILFGTVTMAAGTAVQVHAFRNEVPPGYTRVSFNKDISAKEFVTDRHGDKPHPDVEALVGKRLFFKGFVYPTDQMEGLTSFLLLKDSKECCFGGKPDVKDKVACILQNGKTVNYTPGRVSVSGTFRINPKYNHQESESLYILETDIVTSSKSDF